MPEYIPLYQDAAERARDDEATRLFLRGYLAAAEWLHSDDMDEEGSGAQRTDRMQGWTRKAIKAARTDCADFFQANAADLAEYERLTGRNMESAGTDFFLSREGHGAGFFDRGAGEAGDRLQEAARAYGGCSPMMMRNGWLYFAQ